jgi:hypothetical protein
MGHNVGYKGQAMQGEIVSYSNPYICQVGAACWRPASAEELPALWDRAASGWPVSIKPMTARWAAADRIMADVKLAAASDTGGVL